MSRKTSTKPKTKTSNNIAALQDVRKIYQMVSDMTTINLGKPSKEEKNG